MALLLAVPLLAMAYQINGDGTTPLTKAADEGDLDEVTRLLASAEKEGLNHQDADGWTALIWASVAGHASVTDALIAAGANVNLRNSNGGSALMRASQQGHADIVRQLIAAGAEVNAANRDGWSPLVLASGTGRTEIVRDLLAAGADPRVQTSDGDTPLARYVLSFFWRSRFTFCTLTLTSPHLPFLFSGTALHLRTTLRWLSCW
jgi:ankyrin repeat protein